MRFESTRGGTSDAAFEDVLLAALASDGGLYLPVELPQLDQQEIRDLRGLGYCDLAARLLPRLIGPAIPDGELQAMINQAYGSFHHRAVAPLKQLDGGLWLMELFHGPTLAFKDFALQLLGRLLDHALTRRDEKAVIIGATSGDTGSAAIEACRDRGAIELYMLHPKGRVSDVQRRQMTTVTAANIHNLAVDGSFDDCQAMVKALLNDPALAQGRHVTAVNSINWARVAAQVVYYFHAALALGAPDRAIAFSVPTGNFGNVYAAHLARRMGLPISKLVIGSNRNDILTRFFETGVMQAREVEPSLTPSMDIQVSSNFERLLFELHGRDGDKVTALMQQFRETGRFEVGHYIINQARELFDAQRVSDDETLDAMQRWHRDTGECLDPHTAIGVAAAEASGTDCPVVIVGTAHPAKFPVAVEQATGMIPALPPHAAHLMQLPEHWQDMAADPAQLLAHILTTPLEPAA